MNYCIVHKSQESITMCIVPSLNAFRKAASGGSIILHITVSKAGTELEKILIRVSNKYLEVIL